jgi:hypothetical protein
MPERCRIFVPVSKGNLGKKNFLKLSSQRLVFNFAPRGELWPSGVTLAQEGVDAIILDLYVFMYCVYLQTFDSN